MSKLYEPLSLQLSRSVLSEAFKKFPNLKKRQWSSGYALASQKAMERNPFIEMTHYVVCMSVCVSKMSLDKS